MKNRKCALFLFDGYADWEPSLAITGLAKYSDVSILTFSFSDKEITSMGGLKIRPETSIDNINPDYIDLLLLPGGDVWEEGGNEEIIPLIKKTASKNRPIAAICGATIALAKSGLLDNISHTSNGEGYLQQFCRQYKGAKYFENRPSVSEKGIITANGAAMVEFAHEIYKTLDLFDSNTRDAIKDLYKSGGMDNRLQG